MKQISACIFTFLSLSIFAQKEIKAEAPIEKVTVFKQGAQIEHKKQVSLSTGKQTVIFQKLTDFLDPSSIQLKCSAGATILSVKTRKNFDDKSIAETELKEKNDRKDALNLQERTLRDEYKVLLYDEQLLMKNNSLGSQQQGVKVSELKEASLFFHSKLTEINTRKSQLDKQIEEVVRKTNTIEQEIATRKSLPVINYTEIAVELDVTRSGSVDFEFTYISEKASWKPYYDMRSNGVGSNVLLEAKGLVSQNTGIEWKDIALVLSTNDPYDNTQEPTLQPWELNYYTPAPKKQVTERYIPQYNYDGELIHGEVTDVTNGQPMAFAKITMANNALKTFTTDATGHFSFVVPRGERAYTVSYLGYQSSYIAINAPFTKIQLYPQAVAMETISESERDDFGSGSGSGSGSGMYADQLNEVVISSKNKLSKKELERMPTVESSAIASYNQSIAEAVEKDLRMEFQISTPFSIPSDDAEHRVAISNYQMNAAYEYHAVPKLDESVYLIAQISGWEKLNLLSGDANLYFDGTFIGKTYIDVNSAKDTLNFSLGKDKKIVLERKRSEEMSKTRLNGNRYKYEVTWNFTAKNNGAAVIPLIVKDHFPISINDDIKVKQGNYAGAALDTKTNILTWKLILNKGESKQFSFDYQVDYGKTSPIYLE